MKLVRKMCVLSTLALALNTPLQAVDLADIPLFIGSSVDPNLMFLMDDSGSMAWSYMPDEISGICHNTSSEANRRRGRSHQVNAVYFNPEAEYLPPMKSDGTRMENSDFEAAWVDGYDKTGSVNLSTSFRATWYYQGSYDNRYCGEAGPADYYLYDESCTVGDAGNNACYVRHKLSDKTDVERQNFANWYSYYRNRMFAARAGIGEAFYDLPEAFRLGWGRINSGSSTIDDASSVRAVLEGVRQYEGTRKGNFYDWLYAVPPTGSTPLRRALEGAGKYYETSQRVWADDPSIAVASGSNDMRACRKAFTLMMTDGYYNGSDPASAVAGADDNDGDVITNRHGDSFQYIASDPFKDGADTRTLADVAMHYWKRDLNAGLDNIVPITDKNPAFWQHMATYGVGMGVSGNIAPEDALAAVTNGDPIAWWSGSANENLINDLLHASINGRGGFFSADNPQKFSNELEGIINDIVGEVATATAIDFEASTTQAGSLAFAAQFDPNGWSGDIKAVKVNEVDPPVIPDFNNDSLWSAREKLGERNLAANPRTILTFVGGQGESFHWGKLSAAQQADLQSGVDSITAQKRVDYLRGNRDETTIIDDPAFHPRKFRLGSIVNSSPNFVGAPSSNWSDEGYAEFKADNKDRTPVVYVGANDGMLHGFKATETGGEELLAYIPSFIASTEAGAGMHYLTEPDYYHRYYVDLTTRQQDVYTKGRTSTGSETADPGWRTVLLGGGRGGAKGVFALDVTNPDEFNETNASKLVMWEFSSTDDDRLGHIIRPPVIAKATWGSGDVRWTAFFSNGYNASNPSTGFFMLDVEGGLDGSWTEGSDYKFIEFESGGSGLSPLIELDMTGNLVTDRIYAGDLAGNIWVAEDAGDGDWKSAYTLGVNPAPLFTTPTGTPITSMPEVTANYEVEYSASNAPNVNVYFGTGQYLELNDVTTNTPQYIFGVWDKGTTKLDIDDLVLREFTEVEKTTLGGETHDTRVSEGDPVDYSSKFGWYIQLPTSGERVIYDPAARFIGTDPASGVVYFTSIIPDQDPCAGGGTGWLMAVGFDGTTPEEIPFLSFDEPVAGIPLGSLPNQGTFWGDYMVVPMTDGSVKVEPVPPEKTAGVGRRGWQEVVY